ncbi:MAG: DUF4931 domain-containing protein [Planctomycetota bacterium]
MPAWLHDPVTDRTVRVAADRARRPNDFSSGDERRRCPFCRGSEEDTPAEADRITGPDGQWRVRAVPNLYPAVEGEDGAHEVIVESPRHVVRFADLSDEESTDAVRMAFRRLAHWRSQGETRHTILFKNEGRAAGASLEHVHSQLVALPRTPPAIAAMWDRVLGEPREPTPERFVTELDGWRIDTPAAPRVAWESSVRPAGAGATIEALANDRKACGSLGRTLRRLVAAATSRADATAYNWVLQAPPTDADPRLADRWWIELTPRRAVVAGFELGTGLWINTVDPRAAAAGLREELLRDD